MQLVLLSFTSQAQGSFEEKHIMVSLRMVGHQLLLNTGDSTSRVTSVENEQGQYRIIFEADFEISPEKLVSEVDEVMRDRNIANRYILEVQQCELRKTVYSFEMDSLTHNVIVPCQTRLLPKSCYNLVFTFAPWGTTTSTDQLPDSEQISFSSYYSVVILASLVFILSLLAWRARNKPNQDQHRIKLGKFYFDRRSTMLIMEEQKVELTGKEADLLLILHEFLNETVRKEDLLNKVWGDEGDYIGRTLDVFVSKLRKKFELDPNVRIVNVRGVGYKLVIEE